MSADEGDVRPAGWPFEDLDLSETPVEAIEVDDDLLPSGDDGNPVEAVPIPAVTTKVDKRTGAEYVPKSWKPADRPAVYGGAVTAVIAAGVGLLGAFGVDVDLSGEQTSAVVGFVSAAVALVSAFLVQRRTTPFRDEGDDSDEALRSAVAQFDAAQTADQ